MYLLLMTLVLTLAGCSQNMRSAHFKTAPPPAHGKPITEPQWQAMQEAHDSRKDRRLVVQESLNWPLPFIATARDFSVERNRETGRLDKAQGMQFVFNDLATPLILTTLPLRMKFRLYHYERDTDLPVGFRALTYSPFVFEDRAIGKVDRRYTVRAQGLPLLFADLKLAKNDPEEGTAKRLHATTTLWTLGPAWLTFDTETKANDDPSTRTSTGYAALPLMLGGGLGTILWTDYSLRLTDPDHGGKRRVIGHGPLAGFLGYFDDRAESGTATVTRKTSDGEEREVTISTEGRRNVHVLGGLLWHHYTKRDAATGARVRDRSGPLWSMFGWGHSADSFKVRILFVPIG
jgi:hypothetical protein